jgi:hypothetical protein
MVTEKDESVLNPVDEPEQEQPQVHEHKRGRKPKTPGTPKSTKAELYKT